VRINFFYETLVLLLCLMTYFHHSDSRTIHVPRPVGPEAQSVARPAQRASPAVPPGRPRCPSTATRGMEIVSSVSRTSEECGRTSSSDISESGRVTRDPATECASDRTEFDTKVR